jgi:hypothetical protein
MHGEQISESFINVWPNLFPKIVAHAKENTTSPAFKSFITEEEG